MSPGELDAAVAVLRDAAPPGFPLPVAYVVLGSGLSSLKDRVERARVLPFADIPGLPSVGVQGHAGEYRLGWLAGRAVLVQAGRFHLYEGYPLETVLAPVRIALRMGARLGIFTNAAGGIGRALVPGSLMLIDDQINLTGASPLAGPGRARESRFPDMGEPYDRELQDLALAAGSDLEEPLLRGVYLGLLGPSFETPAEIRMAARVGADAVGMSTVLEVVTARAGGMRCLGFSMITNKAAGLSPDPLAHEDVLRTGRMAGLRLGRVLEGVLGRLS